MRKLSGGCKVKTSAVKSKDGKMTTEKEAIKSRWKEYFQQLYSSDIQPDKTVLHSLREESMEEEPELMKEEVEKGIKDLKRNKSPGYDKINAELI